MVLTTQSYSPASLDSTVDKSNRPSNWETGVLLVFFITLTLFLRQKISVKGDAVPSYLQWNDTSFPSCTVCELGSLVIRGGTRLKTSKNNDYYFFYAQGATELHYTRTRYNQTERGVDESGEIFCSAGVRTGNLSLGVGKNQTITVYPRRTDNTDDARIHLISPTYDSRGLASRRYASYSEISIFCDDVRHSIVGFQ